MSGFGSPGLGRLNAGWRSAYITAATDTERAERAAGRDPHASDQCVFCTILGCGRPDAETLVVHREEHAFVILNAYPYTSGHVLVMPTRHEGELGALTDAERDAVFRLVSASVAAITRAYAPEGLNVGMNLGRAAGAGIPGHLHAHVLPRWNGDTNFMTAVAETRVMPESLDVTWERLRTAWATEDRTVATEATGEVAATGQP